LARCGVSARLAVETEEERGVNTSFVETDAGRIACHHSSGTGPAAVLIHGNSSSARAFTRQLAGPLGERHRLVAIDLPGHGGSANAAGYSLPLYARTLVSVAKQLGLEQAVFVGWSLGGHILLEAAPDLPRAAGFMIHGTPPLAFPPAMEQAFLPNPVMGLGFAVELTREQAAAYVAAFFKPGYAEIPPFFLEDALRTDGKARAELAAGIAPGGYRDEVEVVASLKQPLAVLHGTEEQLISGAYIAGLEMPSLWRGAVQTITDCGHAPQWERAAAFDALLGAFLEDVS
jgi:pimeloyl-ACP methyl ester carboxylesterase